MAMNDSLALGDTDFHLLAEGTHARLYEKLGAHVRTQSGRPCTRFAVWAPNAERVDVIGDWTDWREGVPLRALGLVLGATFLARLPSLWEPRWAHDEGLLAAVPRIDAPRSRLQAIPGQVPAATAWPPGCRFHPRCPYAWDKCVAEEPPLLDIGDGTHAARCWLVTNPERRQMKR